MNGDNGLSTTWAVVLILVVPALIVVAAEIEERLRQSDSPLRSAAQLFRNWVLPFLAIWALLVTVFGAGRGEVVTQLVGSALVLGLCVVALRVLRVVIADVSGRPRTPERRAVPQLLLALPRLAVILTTGWILVGSVWGVDLSAALTALGVTSLIISFALQDTLSGLASGVLLLSDPPFQPGDWIEADGLEGVVVDVNWRTTRIRDRNDDITTIPNSTLAKANITNHSAPTRLHRVVVSLQVAYRNPPTLAKAMLLDAAQGTPGVRSDPAPRVRITQIDDPLMGYEVDMWIDDFTIAPRVRSDFGSLVWYQSHRHQVPLPSPAQDLYLWDGPGTEAAGEPTVADIRQMLQTSPMLSTLAEGDLDRLAQASRPVRFAVGETMLDSSSPQRSVLLLREGQARLVMITEAGDDVVIGDLTAGEIIDLATSTPRGGQRTVLRSSTDCDVVVIDPAVLTEIAGRAPAVADAYNRVAAIRRRRLERLALPRDGDSREAEQGSPEAEQAGADEADA